MSENPTSDGDRLEGVHTGRRRRPWWEYLSSTDGQTIGQLIGEFVDGQTIVELSHDVLVTPRTLPDRGGKWREKRCEMAGASCPLLK